MDIQHIDFDINSIRADFGASAQFQSSIDKIQYNDNYSQIISRGINFLNMQYSLTFSNLTDEDTKKVISFFQSQFYYDVQDYDIKGNFTNKRLEPFDYQPSFPYKKLKFHCLNFNHSKVNYNINNVSATLTCVTPSILDSVESSHSYNPVIDSAININSAVGASTDDQSITLINANSNSHSLQEGNYIFSSGDYRNAKITSVGSSTEVKTSTGMPALTTKTQNNALRSSIFIHEPNECSFYPHEPIYDNSSLNVRFFDFRPTQSIEVSHSPKFKQSSAHDIYKKTNKYGYNPNLKTLSLTFDKRSNNEAKSILLFLESHLGYKKFGFHLQKDYNNKTHEEATTPINSDLSFFYCSDWSHSFVYHNNHTISATFVECPNV